MDMTIKEASKMLHVETHVLRYWEDELKLEIKRNAQGHREYEERDIRLFERVKKMKEEGLTLRDIRNAIIRAKRARETELQPVHTRMDEDKDSMVERMEKAVEEEQPAEIKNSNDEDAQEVSTVRNQNTLPEMDKVVDFKQAQLQSVMNRVIANALRENKDIITTSIKEEVTADVMRQFDTVMREKEEREEARYRRLDQVLREIQQAHTEVAATKNRRRIFGKKLDRN